MHAVPNEGFGWNELKWINLIIFSEKCLKCSTTEYSCDTIKTRHHFYAFNMFPSHHWTLEIINAQTLFGLVTQRVTSPKSVCKGGYLFNRTGCSFFQSFYSVIVPMNLLLLNLSCTYPMVVMVIKAHQNPSNAPCENDAGNWSVFSLRSCGLKIGSPVKSLTFSAARSFFYQRPLNKYHVVLWLWDCMAMLILEIEIANRSSCRQVLNFKTYLSPFFSVIVIFIML